MREILQERLVWVGVIACAAAVMVVYWDVSSTSSASVPDAGTRSQSADLGDALRSLEGEDDEAQSVALGFDFPYGGMTYSTVFVGDNGVVSLGTLGEANDFPSADEFGRSTAPVVAPFWTDLSLASRGAVYAENQGAYLVVTWSEVGSNLEEQAAFTFGLELHETGQIIFVYDGIPSLSGLDETVHVGIGPGESAGLPGEVDLSEDTPLLIDDTLLERFPTDSVFDLDRRSLAFTPQALGGYLVTIPEPSAMALGLAALIAIAGVETLRRKKGGAR